MKYLGGKQRIAKHILPIILNGRTEDQWYVEPMVGGGNVLDKVEGKRIGADINFYIVSLLRAASCGWEPPSSVSEEYYNDIKFNKDLYSPELVGYVGFALSFGGKFFGGYARKNSIGRDYISEAYRQAKKQFPKLSGAYFECCSFEKIDIPKGSIIYCDPPYKGTTGYDGNFDYGFFYDWLRIKKLEGHGVFVSEYSMPDDFKCIWEMPLHCGLSVQSRNHQKIERLFSL